MPGSASIWVLGQVAGPRRPARLLHAGPAAAYLDLDGTCVGVLAAHAVQVPCGVRTSLARLPELSPGDPAIVEDGSVELPGLETWVTSVVDTTVPVVDPDSAGKGAERLADAAGDRLAAVESELPADALGLLAGGDDAAVPRLLGLGRGLTPLGDDVLAGWLATGVATRHPDLPRVRGTVALTARERTTTLSATLLACAARGEGVPEFGALLRGLGAGDDVAVGPSFDRAVDAVLDIGDSSGAGLVLGARLALASLPASPLPSSPLPSRPAEGVSG